MAESPYKLRAWRVARGNITQQEAASEAGIRQQTWSSIETGATQRPHYVTLLAIARALRCTVPQLKTPPTNHD